MDDDSVPESDAFADSEVESYDPGAVGLDERLSDSGGSGAHADGASPYLSRLPRQDAARLGHLIAAARPAPGRPERLPGLAFNVDCTADDPNAGFARGAQPAGPDGVFEGDWRARGEERRPPTPVASRCFGAADDAGVPPPRDLEPYHDCDDDDCGWPRSEGLAGCTAPGDLRERGNHFGVRTRGA